MDEIQSIQNRSFLARIFLAPGEPRLRAGWRLLIQTILLFAIGTLVSIVASFLIPLVGGSLIFGQILNFVAITGSVYIARRWLDRRSF